MKYTKTRDEILDKVFSSDLSYTSADGKMWPLCAACDNALSCGNLPTQAKANNLQLDSIPVELFSLNAFELTVRLISISLRVPFMTMMAVSKDQL